MPRFLPFRRLLRHGEMHQRLDEEIRFHIDMQTDKNLRSGMSPADAKSDALRRFGGRDWWTEATRDEYRRLPWIGDFVADARFALRTLRRSPALAGAAILTLTLGIGATVAIFSAVNAVLLRPLPLPDPERLIVVGKDNAERGYRMEDATPGDFMEWRVGVTHFADVMAHINGSGPVTLTGRGDATLLTANRVTGNFFSTLGVRAAIGRTFRDDETWDDALHVVVLSHRAWRERFGADSAIVGRTITINDSTTQVVGVMPATFTYPDPSVEIWQPLRWNRADRSQQSFYAPHFLRVVGRLRTGASPEAANAQLQVVAARLRQERAATHSGMGATMLSLHDHLVRKSRLPLLVLLASVVVLLLIACANVGNLLLVQAVGREREISLRLALGAARARLLRQAIAEGFVLSGIAGVLGLALGWLGVQVLTRIQPAGLLQATAIDIDPTVIAFAVGVSMASALLFGTAPTLWARRRDPAEALKAGGRSVGTSRRAHGWGQLLVTSEVALALMMTVGAGLLVRSLMQLQRVDPGFDGERVVAAEVALGQRYDSVPSIEAFTNQLVARVRAAPGVAAVATATGLPLTNAGYTSGYIAASRPRYTDGPLVKHRHVSPEYFTTMGVRILKGRPFTAEDRRDGPFAVILNEAFARAYFGTEDPLGQRIAFEPVTDSTRWYSVVGVAESEHLTLESGAQPEVYEAMTQLVPRRFNLLVRTSGRDPSTVVPVVRGIVRELDPTLPIRSVRTMSEIRERAMSQPRFLMLLLLVFAGVGLALSVVGVYGVIGQTAGARVREMSIRVALGASARQVLWMIVRQGLALTTVGIVVGTAVTLLATRAMTRLLFNVAPSDPLTLVGVAAILMATGVVASWLPASRVSRANPAVALRGD